MARASGPLRISERAVTRTERTGVALPRPGPFLLAVCLDGYPVLHSFGAAVARFAVKKIILFLYSAIHKLSTRCSQLIHSAARPNAPRAEIRASVSDALTLESDFA